MPFETAKHSLFMLHSKKGMLLKSEFFVEIDQKANQSNISWQYFFPFIESTQ